MRILALNLGKNKSVAYAFEAQTGPHVFQTVPTARPTAWSASWASSLTQRIGVVFAPVEWARGESASPLAA